MKKIFCDRCGEEIQRIYMLNISQAIDSFCTTKYELTSRTGLEEVRKYDLCPKCQGLLELWLNQKGYGEE